MASIHPVLFVSFAPRRIGRVQRAHYRFPRPLDAITRAGLTIALHRPSFRFRDASGTPP